MKRSQETSVIVVNSKSGLKIRPDRPGNNVHFKDWIPKYLTAAVVYKFLCELCNESYYEECVRHLNVRTGESIGISTFIKKQVKVSLRTIC